MMPPQAFGVSIPGESTKRQIGIERKVSRQRPPRRSRLPAIAACSQRSQASLNADGRSGAQRIVERDRKVRHEPVAQRVAIGARSLRAELVALVEAGAKQAGLAASGGIAQLAQPVENGDELRFVASLERRQSLEL